MRQELFDAEIIGEIASLDLLRTQPIFFKKVPWYQYDADPEPLLESEARFSAKYFFGRPYDKKGPWDSSVCSFMNTVLDRVLLEDERRVDDACRLGFLTTLCREFTKEYPCRTWQYYCPLTGQLFTTTISLERGIPRGTSTQVWPMGPMELHVLIAQLLLGQTQGLQRLLSSGSFPSQYLCSASHILGVELPDDLTKLDQKSPSMLDIGLVRSAKLNGNDKRSPRILGTVLQAAIKTGSVDLVRQFMERVSVNVGDGDQNLLKCAVKSGDINMVKLILDPPKNKPHDTEGLAFESCVAWAIRSGPLDIVWYLLERRSKPYLKFLFHEGMREATRRGDVKIITHLLDTARDQGCRKHRCCVDSLSLACKSGNREAVKLLLAYDGIPAVPTTRLPEYDGIHRPSTAVRGSVRLIFPSSEITHVKCLPSSSRLHRFWGASSSNVGPMLGAAISGHIDIAEMLMEANIDLSLAEWQLVAMGAVEMGQCRFLEWLLDQNTLCTCEASREVFDLLGYACVRGPVEVMELLLARGLLVDRPVWTENVEFREASSGLVNYFDSPLLAAMSLSRTEVVQFLLGHGWSPIDPVGTSVGHLWKSGHFPRHPCKKIQHQGIAALWK